jgi:hypothetical protein
MSMKPFASGEGILASDLNNNFGALDSQLNSINAVNIVSGTIDPARLPMRRVDHFTANGTWTPPAGVTYAIAYVRGGGGGVGRSASGTGGTTTVNFPSGAISAGGGAGQSTAPAGGSHYAGDIRTRSGAPNSGSGARYFGADGVTGVPLTAGGPAGRDGAFIVGAGTVTPGQGVTVTIGTGGSAGTSGAAGASGYAYIEYYA